MGIYIGQEREREREREVKSKGAAEHKLTVYVYTCARRVRHMEIIQYDLINYRDLACFHTHIQHTRTNADTR